jgi:hypothetical protein
VSLIAFHRVLIAAGILFCFGFAAWELVFWWVTRATGALVMGIVFVLLGAGLCWYLSRLGRFLGYEKGKPGE